MKVSIVSISLNQSNFLSEALASIISQNHVDMEYIVIDAGSTDGSRELIKRYENKIDHVILEPDRGPADGLNKGFAVATGEILGFINADDALLPGALHFVSDFFHSNPEVDVLLGAGFLVDGQGRILRRILPSRFSVKRFLTGGFEFLQQSTFFRRRALNVVNGFNVENHTCWDGELLLDMGVAQCNFARTMRNLAVFRLHSASLSGSERLKEAYARDKERLFRKVMNRRRTNLDRIIGLLYRVEKWSSNPWFYGMRFVKHGRFRPNE